MRMAERTVLARLIDGDLASFPGWEQTGLLLPKSAKRFLDHLFAGTISGTDKVRRILSFGADCYRAGLKHGRAYEKGLDPVPRKKPPRSRKARGRGPGILSPR